MGARFDRLRCEVFQNLFLSPMNTGFVRPAVATVLTVYGIETVLQWTVNSIIFLSCNSTYRLRYWNFDAALAKSLDFTNNVATVLTVYGIETKGKAKIPLAHAVATVLTVYGIETSHE